MKAKTPTTKSLRSQIGGYLWILFGAFLAAFSIEVFLIPKNLIDGGVIGISMIASYLFGKNLLPLFLTLFTSPFLYMGYRYIGKVFVQHMLAAVIFFAGSIFFIHHFTDWVFIGESLEVVVIGGAVLGIGTGLIIRYGGCIDGTEILGIIINRSTGITVGQVVLVCNVFIFTAAGLVFQDWHPPILSLITFMVATKVMDAVIIGMEETKSVWIISQQSQEISKRIMHELGLGVTIIYGRGGFSGEEREILYVISERLQLAELKELTYSIDPTAFVAIENLHEVSNGVQRETRTKSQKKVENMMTKIFRSS
jgi:uncharacterized membrane-anchored protein YitT (DUF2179 family)